MTLCDETTESVFTGFDPKFGSDLIKVRTPSLY